jgi:hypothetical protein
LKPSVLATKAGGVLRYRYRQEGGFGLLPEAISNSLRTCNELEGPKRAIFRVAYG